MLLLVNFPFWVLLYYFPGEFPVLNYIQHGRVVAIFLVSFRLLIISNTGERLSLINCWIKFQLELIKQILLETIWMSKKLFMLLCTISRSPNIFFMECLFTYCDGIFWLLNNNNFNEIFGEHICSYIYIYIYIIYTHKL